jgi:xanthine dehydrogenase large subunit
MLVYADGTVQLNHGGTEMGQGLHTKMMAIAAHELGVTMASVRAMVDLDREGAQHLGHRGLERRRPQRAGGEGASAEIRERMRPVAQAPAGGRRGRNGRATIRFEAGYVGLPGVGAASPSPRWREACWVERDQPVGDRLLRHARGPLRRRHRPRRPFYYYAYGAAVTEVEVSASPASTACAASTSSTTSARSLVPSIDIGQVEGGFVQGLGWLTMEEVLFARRRPRPHHRPVTYKIPARGRRPPTSTSSCWSDAPQPGVIHGSKAVGEPPLMLAISVVSALRHALRRPARGPRARRASRHRAARALHARGRVARDRSGARRLRRDRPTDARAVDARRRARL